MECRSDSYRPFSVTGLCRFFGCGSAFGDLGLSMISCCWEFGTYVGCMQVAPSGFWMLSEGLHSVRSGPVVMASLLSYFHDLMASFPAIHSGLSPRFRCYISLFFTLIFPSLCDLLQQLLEP